jgi:hypothetical protein
MAGAALPVAGISIGYGIIQSSRITPAPWVTDVGRLGFRLMQASVIVFVAAMTGFALIWLNHARITRRRR